MALLVLTGAMIVFRLAGVGLGSFLKSTLGSMIPLRGEGVIGVCEPGRHHSHENERHKFGCT